MYLHEECEKGKVIGLVTEVAKYVVQISKLWPDLLGHSPGKWRLIVDLSSPASHSANDGIDPRL